MGTFVVALQPGIGHWARMGAVAAALQERGHRVIVATSAAFRSFLPTSVTAQDFMQIGPSFCVESILEQPPSGDLRDSLRARAEVVASAFFLGAEQVYADLIQAFRLTPPDMFVIDYTLFGAPPAAHALGVPWAAMYGLTPPFRSPGWPPFGSHLMWSANPLIRARHALLDRQGNRENRDLYRPVLRLWEGAGVRLDTPWRAYADLPALGIVGSIERLDFPWSGFKPPTLYYVGPLLRQGDEFQPLDAEVQLFVEAADQGPLVHVTLGVAFSQRADVLLVILEALSRLQCRVLVSTGLVDPATIAPSPRLLVRRSVDHSAVLGHCDVLVCHGGANTLMKAMWYGIPVLIIPLGAEQRSNGARFAFAGAGKTLLPTELNSVRLAREVEILLDANSRHRTRCAEIAVEARAAGGAEHAAVLIETAWIKSKP